MAYDKVVDSAVLNANLTTVADAIRAKGGTSDALSFPTGFADAIAAIQAGGGGGGGIIEKGTITNESETTSLEVYLSKNKWNDTIPQYVIMLKHRTQTETITKDSDCLVAYFWERVSVKDNGNSFEVQSNITEIGYQGTSLKIPDFLYNNKTYLPKSAMNNDQIPLINILANNWGMYLKAGVTYEWVAIGGF